MKIKAPRTPCDHGSRRDGCSSLNHPMVSDENASRRPPRLLDKLPVPLRVGTLMRDMR